MSWSVSWCWPSSLIRRFLANFPAKEASHLLQYREGVIGSFDLEAGDEDPGHLLRLVGPGTLLLLGSRELSRVDQLLNRGLLLLGGHFEQQPGQAVRELHVRTEKLPPGFGIAVVG